MKVKSTHLISHLYQIFKKIKPPLKTSHKRLGLQFLIYYIRSMEEEKTKIYKDEKMGNGSIWYRGL